MGLLGNRVEDDSGKQKVERAPIMCLDFLLSILGERSEPWAHSVTTDFWHLTWENV